MAEQKLEAGAGAAHDPAAHKQGPGPYGDGRPGGAGAG
jgi:hypothetical protein